MSQYTEENCKKAEKIFNDLIDNLEFIGENAPDDDKLKYFKSAIEKLNIMNKKDERLIETNERENLCYLFDRISIASGLDGSIVDLWRDW